MPAASAWASVLEPPPAPPLARVQARVGGVHRDVHRVCSVRIGCVPKSEMGLRVLFDHASTGARKRARSAPCSDRRRLMAFISLNARFAEHRTRLVCLGVSPSPRVRCLLACFTYLLTYCMRRIGSFSLRNRCEKSLAVGLRGLDGLAHCRLVLLGWAGAPGRPRRRCSIHAHILYILKSTLSCMENNPNPQQQMLVWRLLFPINGLC